MPLFLGVQFPCLTLNSNGCVIVAFGRSKGSCSFLYSLKLSTHARIVAFSTSFVFFFLLFVAYLSVHFFTSRPFADGLGADFEAFSPVVKTLDDNVQAQNAHSENSDSQFMHTLHLSPDILAVCTQAYFLQRNGKKVYVCAFFSVHVSVSHLFSSSCSVLLAQFCSSACGIIVVCLDVGGSMNNKFCGDLTRLDCVKEFFNAFSNGTMAYNYAHQVRVRVFLHSFSTYMF